MPGNDLTPQICPELSSDIGKCLRNHTQSKVAGSGRNANMFTFVLSTLLAITSAQELTSVQSKLDQVYYLYPNQVREERQLPECVAGEVCSTEHHRYWLPTLVRRYCRCPTSDCAEQVAGLDNRSHVKVCTIERDQLQNCSGAEIGLEATSISGKRDTVKVHCRCPWPAYWALAAHVENATLTHDKYACLYNWKSCQESEFCGHIRDDTYSMYVQCRCPPGFICLNKGRATYNITEALYRGPAMRAYCLPYKEQIEI